MQLRVERFGGGGGGQLYKASVFFFFYLHLKGWRAARLLRLK